MNVLDDIDGFHNVFIQFTVIIFPFFVDKRFFLMTCVDFTNEFSKLGLYGFFVSFSILIAFLKMSIKHPVCICFCVAILCNTSG